MGTGKRDNNSFHRIMNYSFSITIGSNNNEVTKILNKHYINNIKKLFTNYTKVKYKWI